MSIVQQSMYKYEDVVEVVKVVCPEVQEVGDVNFHSTESSASSTLPNSTTITTTTIDNNVLIDDSVHSKWSKNGYGEVCPRSGGKFTKEETEMVRRAVEDYCALKDISIVRLCSECDHKAELKGAWMEIAKRLPHRTVQSVYRHGLRQLHPFRRGPWTEAECQTLSDLVTRMGKKWSAIQAKLNRSADSCRDKYREMSSEFVKGRWKENETEILKRLIREHLRVDPNTDIKELGKIVERENIIIPWSTISKRMTKRSRLSCFKKWQKMTGITTSSVDSLHLKTTIANPPTHDILHNNHDIFSNTSSSDTLPLPASASIPSTVRNAPTAGAAAAAAARLHQPHPQQQQHQHDPSDYDFYILSEISQSGVTLSSEVNWETFSPLTGVIALQRWEDLLQEFHHEVHPDNILLELPISEVARLLLDRKQQAKMAAETVEAVDLPLLTSRDVHI